MQENVIRVFLSGENSISFRYNASMKLFSNQESQGLGSHLPLFTFIQKFIVLQRGYHHARRPNKMNRI